MGESFFMQNRLSYSRFDYEVGNEFRNYFIVVLILIYEVSPFFILLQKLYFWCLIFILLLFFNRGKKILPEKIIFVLAIVWVLIVIQAILYNKFSPAGIYWPLMFIYTPFLVFTLMGLNFFKYLLNVILFVAIYTTVIYLTHTIFPPFYNFLIKSFNLVFPFSWADWPRSILIYSIPRESGYFFMRNSGIFHEPGAYALYLMLAVLINTFYNKSPFNWKNIFLFSVLITTFSTAGYIMLFIYLFYVIIKLKVHFVIKPIIVLPFVLLLIGAYQKSSFLDQKVNEQIETQSNLIANEEIGQRGRFYSFGMAIKSVANAPFVGRGILALSIKEQDLVFAGGYGLPGLLSRFGIIFSLFYIWYFYKGVKAMSYLILRSTFFTIIAFIIINLGLLSQAFFFATPFIYIFIVGLFSKAYTINNSS